MLRVLCAAIKGTRTNFIMQCKCVKKRQVREEIATGSTVFMRKQCLYWASERANGNFHQLEAHKCEHACFLSTLAGVFRSFSICLRKQIRKPRVSIDTLLFTASPILCQCRKHFYLVKLGVLMCVVEPTNGVDLCLAPNSNEFRFYSLLTALNERLTLIA